MTERAEAHEARAGHAELEVQFPLSSRHRGKIWREDDSGWDDIDLEVHVLTAKQAAQVSQIIGPALASSLDKTLLLSAGEYGADAMTALSIALRQPIGVIERLEGPFLAEVAAAVWQRNVDRFKGRLGHRVSALLGTLTIDAVTAGTANGSGPMSSHTSGSTAMQTPER